MNRYTAEVIAIVSSYGYSALSYMNEVNLLGTITALSGAILTLMLALEAKRRADGLKLDNEIKESQLKDGKNQR